MSQNAYRIGTAYSHKWVSIAMQVRPYCGKRPAEPPCIPPTSVTRKLTDLTSTTSMKHVLAKMIVSET